MFLGNNMFEVFFSNKARKQYKDLDAPLKERVKIAVTVLSLDPYPRREFDLIKLQGFVDTYRIRIGHFRLVYNVDTNSHTINILKIEKRGSVYD